MKLIADSGSTNTKWALLRENEPVVCIDTEGINPFFRSSNDIFDELKSNLQPQIKGTVNSIFFYGAGVTSSEKGGIIKESLLKLFPDSVIQTHSDLLAVAHATCGNKKGIACILGTGSNSGLYDGEKIIHHVPSLGYILGDEASGAVIGRRLLADYLKKIMPLDLLQKFEDKYHPQYDSYMDKVYKDSRPNTFLASFLPFLYENIEEQYCYELIENEFIAFVHRNIIHYPNFKNLDVHFVGSVGYHFQDILKSVVKINNLKCGKILKDPMEGLINYHISTK